ncbi:hypothetical protein F5X68DRAFT_197646 [Plectosphaerella plurivora]|uniref:DNA replication factor Cdt1 C-terminal domain-containing protein n=1 Tax=Plectosphaerella plurivora TaxID=936078 RepID=A0A9P9AFZ1_9PEZI|nr:hypothetical protein F5X68DRAFT_197646 [Plectosphaerella plurivora]
MAKTASQRRTKPAPAAASISKFGRVSKNYAPVGKSDKKVLAVCLPNSKAFGPVTVTCIDDSSDVENKAPVAVPTTEAKPSKKRKADLAEETVSTPAAIASRNIKRSRVLTQVEPNTASSPIKKSLAKKDGNATSRKVSRSKKPIPAAFRPKPKLPTELLDLLNLQKAILKTVVLQMTHQTSAAAPIDIDIIMPQVTRTWGKRQATVDDIRRCIAIQDSKSNGDSLRSPFTVTDFGRGRLCLELVDSTGGVIDEHKLCKRFEETLHAMCADRAVDEMSDLDISFESLSFTELPKSEITKRHHADMLNPALAKGARALTDLKQGLALKQQEREAKVNAPKLSVLDTFAGKKVSLLDRLRAKEAARALEELPSGPELARKRALERVSEIASIVGMLANASNPSGLPVLSFTMAILQQKIKDSLRSPIPIEEGIDTIKIIANEVAPQWLRVVSMGGKEHVVIQTRNKPYDSVLTQRVNALVA